MIGMPNALLGLEAETLRFPALPDRLRATDTRILGLALFKLGTP